MATRAGRRDGGTQIEDGRLVLTDETGTAVQTVPAVVCEQIRSMVNRLRLTGGAGELTQRIGIVSTLSGEGTTTVARALGLVLSHDFGLRVCIVDLNFWSPFEWSNPDEVRSGLAEVLAAGVPVDAVTLHTGNIGLTLLRRAHRR